MKEIYLGQNPIKTEKKQVDGQFIDLNNEKFYKISNVQFMPDFFMTIVSNSDHWMYLSSNGSLSAGRKNRDNALFPYYTVDKIHDYKGKTGSKTICLVQKEGKIALWEPFSDESKRVYNIERNLYKSIYGNKIIFEEINQDLEVRFSYGWHNSDKFGWIKKSTIENLGDKKVNLDLIDGIRNILPYGADSVFQNEFSNLLDAYKKNELLAESKLGLFVLSSIPVDRAEPSEALKATTVWSYPLNKSAKYLISDKQLEPFISGQDLITELDIRAARGSYYVNISVELGKNGEKEWYIVAEVNQDASDVANLDKWIKSGKDVAEKLEEDIAAGTNALIKIVANADGLQLGNEKLGFARHFSNTLFNVMRGGIYTNNYTIDSSDFRRYVNQTNKEIEQQFSKELNFLPIQIEYSALLDWARKLGNPDVERICYEYLPLTFSRRHGDPSRPWNQFSIETKNDDGSDKLNYQGNWRDIFQNWEALSLSFPEYIEGIIAKFVNASTADGYNPYRITRDGIDWESPDPNDPWAYIGYWGDHQIIYLQKFLEQSEDFHPGKLDEMLHKEIFVYANVPYRIKPFEALVEDPKSTIDFDAELNSEIEKRAQHIGADGKLLTDKNSRICKANLMEKILATLLAKLSNFVPEAGIWLNTQRPEWNDANNALVGNGVSMVTLYYLRRFLAFWKTKFDGVKNDEFAVSEELKVLFDNILEVFETYLPLTETGFTNEERYRVSRALGMAGSEYRNTIYKSSFSANKKRITIGDLSRFVNLALKYIDQSIQKNKREDGLYHAYNLIAFKGQSIAIRYLYEMLEGQVAVLSSGLLSAGESLQVMDALKASKLFREDQYSYILYPDRELPRFNEKNNIPTSAFKKSGLLQKLLVDNETGIIKKDESGTCHFNGTFRNAGVLKDALESLDKDKYGDLVQKEKQLVLDIYEEIFDHQSFTGRSGTFFAYEGLGSIYWHMVSKLLLAVQESYFNGIREGADATVLGSLMQHYYEIKAGIGLHKSPELYGAFPTDAYSHTPANAGAKQPGLTGQVKEDVISRFGELGVHIENGRIAFNTSLLNNNEWLQSQDEFVYLDLEGNPNKIELKSDQLAFTFCQVPVVYTAGQDEFIDVTFSDHSVQHFPGNAMDVVTSAKIFSRRGEVKKIEFTTKNLLN